MEPVSLRHGQILSEPDDTLEWVYFPSAGMLSMLTVLEDGEAIEAASVGNEGMSGVQIALGASRATTRTVVQLEGHGLRIPADKFRFHLGHSEALRALTGRYAGALFTLFAQSAACNRLHPVELRCARWLLMTHDRAEGDVFPLTQEVLAQMLGVRRASVSVAAGALQESGYISYRHGKVTVTNRQGLESGSCECYRVIRRRFDRMFAE